MRTYERNLSSDTVLCGGLIAIAMAWLAFSAVQLSPGIAPPAAVNGYAAVAPEVPRPDAAADAARHAPAVREAATVRAARDS